MDSNLRSGSVILGSSPNQNSPDWKTNVIHNEQFIGELKKRWLSIISPDEDEDLVRHRSRGKLFVRQRIEALLDHNSPFLEIGGFAGLDIYERVRPGAGIVTGIGKVNGRLSMIVANDATVKGGTYFPLTVKKHLRAQEIALENRLPCIYLVDSGGAYLPMQEDVFPDREHFGRIFYNQARMSAAGIPQIAVVLGSCTAGGAYVPAMSDQAIIVREQGTIFLGGPPLVKAATGEEVTAEELGGGEVHSAISGVTDHLATDDYHALTLARSAVSFGTQPILSPIDRITPQLPRYEANDILGLIPSDPKKYFPIRDILGRILDDSQFDEFKPLYGKTVICGFARLDGYLVGIVANDGILFSESSLKATHFIQLCDRRRVPLLFFQNISGFMVGKDYEHQGIAKHGAKMVTAVSCVSVPKITIICGGSFGAGNYGMSGRAYQPRFLFTWTNSRTCVMGPEQAAQVLTQVKRDGYKVKNQPWAAEDEERYRKEIEERYNTASTAWFSSARLWDDGIIDPRLTRDTISLCLYTSQLSEWGESKFGVFRT